jgi:transposase
MTSVAIAESGRGGEVRFLGEIPSTPEALHRLVERLKGRHRQLSFCYEAGPCGYGVHRLLSGLGQDCSVVAPSLIPSRPGDRVKTNRRDATTLARLHRAGELAPVWVPDAAHEAMRDLVRARATARRVLGKARQHLQGFLLRHGRIYRGIRGWTRAYRRWLTTVRFDHPAQQIVLQDYIHAVEDAEARLERLERQIEELRQLMAYLGLVPSEHSSGSGVRRGGITKAGNAHARRVLIEGAWTYRMQARVSRKLLDRIERVPQAIRDIAWRAQLRLCHRYRRLAAAGKPKVVVTTAIAREMVGFIWAIARIVQPQPAIR